MKQKKIKRIVLINPPMKKEQIYGSLADWGSITPPIALCYIAGFLRENGYKVFIIDAEAKGYNTGKTLNAVIEAGGGKLSEIIHQDIPRIGKITFVYAKDPEGNFIELQKYD